MVRRLLPPSALHPCDLDEVVPGPEFRISGDENRSVLRWENLRDTETSLPPADSHGYISFYLRGNPMKSLLSPVAVYVATLLLFSMAPISADTARGAGDGPVPQGAALPPNLLDGRTFVAQSGEKGKQASKMDTFVFRDGRFLSETCTPYGFGDAPYQSTVDGATVRFHAETHSPTHGKMVWDGNVKDNAIEATSIWTRERWYWNIKKEYWFRGQMKK
jgi:hypothetical protein